MASQAAMKVGLALWYFRGLKKTLSFKIGLAQLAKELKCSVDTARRGLSSLERKGLVTVERRSGCKPVVTLLESPSQGASIDHSNEQHVD